ncbi:hypothetical protein GGR53DRAFT_464920 [Hypoxylon sp. FL1150]|nr:hypothetical protein GGR53DRAFT_464920 [Hypoxylon sp. FL1150]
MRFQPQIQPPDLPTDDGLIFGIRGVIQVFHPGYTPPYILLNLQTSDDGCLFYDIVYYACCIVAGNIWHSTEGGQGPFLSKSRDPSDNDRFLRPGNDLVPSGIYYFHVPKDSRRDSAEHHSSPYPIIPTFDNWMFPTSLPEPWQQLAANNPLTRASFSVDPKRPDCLVTGARVGLEDGHCVLKSAQSWLKFNLMRQFIKFELPNATHSAKSNHFYVRRDLHYLWDNNYIVLVPKRDTARGNEYHLATHVLAFPSVSFDACTEMHAQFHNRPCRPIPHVPVQLLFARFAWAIFSTGVIKMLTDNVADELYSVLITDVHEDKVRTYFKEAPLSELPKLLSKATGTKKTGTKRKNDQICQDDGQVEHDDLDEEDDIEHPATRQRRSSNLVFSTRTGRMEPSSDQDRIIHSIPRRGSSSDLVFSTVTGQMEPNNADEGVYWPNSDSDNSSSYFPFFSDNDGDSAWYLYPQNDFS